MKEFFRNNKFSFILFIAYLLLIYMASIFSVNADIEFKVLFFLSLVAFFSFYLLKKTPSNSQGKKSNSSKIIGMLGLVVSILAIIGTVSLIAEPLVKETGANKPNYPKFERIETPCADGKGRGAYISEAERIEAYQFGLKIQQAVEREDVNSLFELINGELSHGPRKKDILGKSFDAIFTTGWKEAILAEKPSCYPNGSRGYVLGGDLVWYDELGEGGKWSIHSIVGAHLTDSPRSDEPSWVYGSDLLRPTCFTEVWASGDNYEFYHEHYGGNSAYPDFVRNIGKYMGAKIPLEAVTADWGNKVSLAVELNKCSTPYSSLGKPIKLDDSNATITIEITDKAVRETCSSDTYECESNWAWYTVLRKTPLEACGLLAPHFKNDCIDIRLVQYAPAFRGGSSPASIYGIIKDRLSKRIYMVPLVNFNTANEALNYVDRLLADLSTQDSKKPDPPVQEYKVPEGELIKDISIKDLFGNEETYQCGSHFLRLQTSGEERASHSEHLVITDSKGNKFNTNAGYQVSEVTCTDLTGDKKPDLFLQLWGGGNSATSYSSYVYLLEDPIKLVFEHDYLVNKFVDLNGDGTQEISSWYPFRYFEGLCGVCSPSPERKFCYQNGRFNDCSSQYPDFLKWKIAQNKEQIITTELNKYSGDPKNLDITHIKALSVEILAYAMLGRNEKKELQYLSKVLPVEAFEWLDNVKANTRKILNMKNSGKGNDTEVNRFLEYFPSEQKVLAKHYMTGFEKEELTYPKVIQGQNGGYKVTLKIFKTKVLAEKFRAELLKKGLSPNVEQREGEWELFIGPYPSEESANQAKSSAEQGDVDAKDELSLALAESKEARDSFERGSAKKQISNKLIEFRKPKESIEIHSSHFDRCNREQISFLEFKDLIFYSMKAPLSCLLSPLPITEPKLKSTTDGKFDQDITENELIRLDSSGKNVLLVYNSSFDGIKYDGPIVPLKEGMIKLGESGKIIIFTAPISDEGVIRIGQVSSEYFIVQVGTFTHDRTYLISTTSMKAEYLSDGFNIEVVDREKLVFKAHGRKSYFKGGGAFWYNAIIDRNGKIIDIVNEDLDPNSPKNCYSKSDFLKKADIGLPESARDIICVNGY